MSEPDELGDVLRHAVARMCPSCGWESVGHQICTACGQAIPVLPEERAISFREGALVYSKTPLEESPTLMLLTGVVQGLAAGNLGLEEYRLSVAQVQRVSQAGWQMFQNHKVMGKLGELAAGPADVIKRTREHYELFLEGCNRMLEADDAQQAEAAAEGLEMVREALTGLDRLEDEATDGLRELAFQEELAKLDQAPTQPT